MMLSLPIQAFPANFISEDTQIVKRFRSISCSVVTCLLPCSVPPQMEGNPVHACGNLLQWCLTVPLYGLQSVRLLCPWDSPSKNSEVGC